MSRLNSRDGTSAIRYAILETGYWDVLKCFGGQIYESYIKCYSIFKAQEVLRPKFANRYRIVKINLSTDLTEDHNNREMKRELLGQVTKSVLVARYMPTV